MQKELIDKKIMYLIGDLGNGGQERQLCYLINQLVKSNYKVLLIVWTFHENQNYANSFNHENITLIKLTDEHFLKKINIARKAASAFSPKVLHSYTFYLNFIAFLITLAKKTIGIGGIRSNISHHIKKPGKLLGILSVIFPKYKISNNSKFLSGLHNPVLKYFLKDTHIVKNHLDISNFSYKKEIPGTIIKTASIGRLYAEKRLDVLVDVINILVKNGHQIIHYHAGTGELQSDIENKIQKRGIQNNLILVGEVKNVSNFLEDKAVFIHTSDYEGYPNVIMEAMACGKPIVTTECGDVSDLVQQDVNGFIVPVGGATLQARKVGDLLLDPDLRTQMGRTAREYAEENFSLEHLMSETIKVYNKICVE